MSANNDEADDLVREVIEENPPEEQGIRPEWQEHVGWGRKEDIYNLRGQVDATTTEEFHQSDYSAKAVGGKQHETADRSLSGRLDQSLNVVLAFLLPIVVALFAVYYYCISSKKLCGTKPRKTEAHLV
jgi:hypothetical protein